MKRNIFIALIFLFTVLCFIANGATGDEGGIITGSNLFETFDRGGFMMWPILLCSVVTLAFVLERMVGLRTQKIFPAKLNNQVKILAGEGKLKEAIQLCDDNPSLFAKFAKACLSRAKRMDLNAEFAMEEVGSRILYDLRKNTRPLGFIAEAAPLLGLMGTVFGMIRAFQAVAQSGALGRTKLLAEGIGEALLTTAFGLIVAVLALVAYQLFRSKADNLLKNMEDSCLEMLEDLQEQSDK